MRPAGLKDGKPSRLRDEELGIIGDRKKGRLEQTGAPRGFVREESSMNQTDMLLLYEYNAWADRRVLEAASALTPEQYNKQMGSSFSSVRDTLSHIYGVEWLWLERFQGSSPSAIPDDAAYADITKLKQSWAGFEPALLNFVRGGKGIAAIHAATTLRFRAPRLPRVMADPRWICCSAQFTVFSLHHLLKSPSIRQAEPKKPILPIASCQNSFLIAIDV